MIIAINAFIAFLLFSYNISENINLKKMIKYLTSMLLILSIIFFIAFRGTDAGLDTPFYVDAYNNIHSFLSSYNDGASVFGGKEPLLWYLSGIQKSFLGFSADQWIMTNTAISFILFYITYLSFGKQMKIHIFIPFTLLFFTYFFVSYGNIMRQMLALPFLFLAIISYENKRYSSFSIYTLLAIGFHISAAIVLVYPFYKIFHIKYWLLLIMSLILFILAPTLIDVALHILNNSYFLEKWTLYTTTYISPYGPMFKRPTVMSTLAILLVYVYLFRKKNYSDLLFSINLFFIFILIATAFNAGISERFIIYIYFLLPISLWKMTTLLQTEYQQKMAQLFIILLFYLQSIYIFSKEGVLFTLGIQNGGLF